MLVNQSRNDELAEALITGIRDARLESKIVLFKSAAMYSDDFWNPIWHSPNPLLSQDLSERINFANQSALDLFGENIFGTPSIDLVPDDYGLRKQRAEAFKEVIETGVPKYFENSPRIIEDGELGLVTGWAFRYHLNRGYSIGALLLPYSQT